MAIIEFLKIILNMGINAMKDKLKITLSVQGLQALHQAHKTNPHKHRSQKDDKKH